MKGHFVFKEPSRSTGFIGCLWVSQNNAFPSMIDDILKELLQVFHTLTYLLWCNMYIFTLTLTKELNYEKGTKYKVKINNGVGYIIRYLASRNALRRSHYAWGHRKPCN